MNEIIKKYLLDSKIEIPKILDLGFCSPSGFFCLFKEFKSKLDKAFTYTGVEKCDAYNVFFRNCPHLFVTPEYQITTGDWVKNFNNQGCMNLSEDENFLIDEDTFDRHFNLNFETDVVDYLKISFNTQKYDCIILSNILHKLSPSNAEFVFEKCLDLLEQDSIIYISVLGNDYKRALPEDNLYTYERYSVLKNKLKVLWFNENVQTHFQLIGGQLNPTI